MDATLELPFFESEHRRLHADLSGWLESNLDDASAGHGDPGPAVRTLVRELASGGWLSYAVPQMHDDVRRLDVRTVCLMREALAYRSGLADVAFAMQGLGSLPIALFGSDELRRRYLSEVTSGTTVAAFAISEEGAGSDIAGITTVAREERGHWIIDGRKVWISNAPIAGLFVVFARTEEGAGSKGLSAFAVDGGSDGMRVEPVAVSAPHPIGTVEFDAVRLPADRLIGSRGDGFKIAMVTLDHFRATVGAAAVGFARRALSEALTWVGARTVGDRKLADYDLTRERLADMAVDVDAATLLVYRAAWMVDRVAGRHSRETSMAKLYATEAAQRVVDSAVQLLGARGVVDESPVERLYREVRPLRIYEGTSEIQKLIIARDLLATAETKGGDKT